jgi:hypothetical protein
VSATEKADGSEGRGSRRIVGQVLGGVLAANLTTALLAAAAVESGLIHHGHASTPVASTSTGSASVRQGDISLVQQVAGQLGYDGSYSIPGGGSGVITWLPAAGAVVSAGHPLYDVNGAPVVMLHGVQPAWRAFTSGMTNGSDVSELNQALIDSGDDPHHCITVNGGFTDASQAAIRRLQAALGIPLAQRTGELPIGSVAFLPEQIRISGIAAALGDTAQAGHAVLTGTSTRRIVTVQLPVDQQTTVAVHDAVRVALPDGSNVDGRIASISPVATAAGTSSSSSTSSGSGSSSTTTPTVPVNVALTAPLPAADADLDQAPVQVGITEASHHSVLIVPITALLAGPDGGYQVRALNGAASRLITVSLGLFDDTAGTVEVTGSGLATGNLVEVPSS